MDVVRQDDRERFVQWLRSKTAKGGSEAWSRECVSLLDAVGGPQNFAAYFHVLLGMRNLLGWGYRSGWLQSLSNWEFLHEIYGQCGWIRHENPLLLGNEDGKSPQFARPGYQTLFGEAWNYGRLADIVVLMTLVRLGKSPARDQIAQAQIDELTLATERQDEESLTLVKIVRRAGEGIKPIKLFRVWRIRPGDRVLDSPDATRRAIQTAASVAIDLWDSALPKPEPPGSEASCPRKVPTGTATARAVHRFRVRQLGDGTELFALKVVVVPRPGASDEDAQPEDREQVQFTLESSAEITKAIGQATPERTRAFITARQRNAIDWLLVPAQPNALLEVEARSVVAEMLKDASDAMTDGNHALLGVNLMLLVIAVGALSTQEVRAVRCATLDYALTESKEVVITPEGYLVRSVPMPPSRYRPKAGAKGLHEVGSRVVLRLPREMHALLERWIEISRIDVRSGKARLFASGGLIGKVAISRRNNVIRGRTQVRRFTAQRLCNTLPLLLMAATHDVSKVQMVTGHAQGLSPVGCAYFSPTLSQLQAEFDEGVEAMGFTRAPSETSVSGMRVGSQLCMQDVVVRTRVKHLGYGLNYFARYMHDHDNKNLVENHNRMVLYTGWLLQACLATRYYRTVGEMKLSDVTLDPGWMVIDDKCTDEAHAARLVCVSPLAVAQIRAFASHLDVLSRRADVSESVRREIRDALESRRSLVFFVEADRPVAWGKNALRKFDPDWTRPSNALRHRAATHWRLQGCPGDFVASQLGHVELGHVLSMDSPTPPDHFHAVVTHAIDAYAKADGWSVKQGYGSGNWSESVVLPSLMEVQHMQTALETQERLYLSGKRSWGAPETNAEATNARQAVADLLTAKVANIARAGEVPRLDVESMRGLRTEVARYCENNPARTEWALGELHGLVMQGVKEKDWLCDDQRRVFRILVEPSPVAVGILASHRAYREISAWYTAALPVAMASSTDATLWRWLALGLILDEFITDRVDLQSMLDGLKTATRPRKEHDVLMVPLARTAERAAQVTFLRGRPALLAARFHHQGANLPRHGVLWRTLEAWLHEVLPKALQPREGSLLTWLLGVTRLASRLELPGLLRAVRDNTLSVSALPAERMARLLDERPSERPTTVPVFARVAKAPEEKVAKHVTVDRLMADVLRELRSILKKTTPQQYHLAHDVKPERKLIREDKKRRLGEVISRIGGAGEVVRLVLEYAYKLLEKGSPHKSNLADKTIYAYACDVAAAFARMGEQLPKSGLLDHDADDLEDLYKELLEKRMGARVRDHLRYFQEFLEERYHLPQVSSQTVLSGSKPVAQTEVDLITAREYHAALGLLGEAMNTHRGDAWRLWRLKAARVAMILMFRGSLRIGEVMGRLHSDLHVAGAQCILHIHRTRFGGLKTPSAKRIVVFGGDLLEEELDALRSWLKDAWLPDKRKHRDRASPLFPDKPWEGLTVVPDDLVEIISTVLRAATGDPTARPHRLRHSAGSYGVLQTLGAPLLVQLRQGRTTPSLRRCDIVRLKAWIGHESIRTTLKSYIHTMPLVLHRIRVWTYAYKGEELANIIGIGHDLLRRKRADLVKRGRSPDELPALLMRRYVPAMQSRGGLIST